MDQAQAYVHAKLLYDDTHQSRFAVALAKKVSMFDID